jgi:Uma2 family endonuclease
MAEPATRKLDIDEFLAWDDGTDRHYELVRGDIVAMAPPQHAHGAIVANIVGELRNQLKRPCHAVAEAGIVRPDRSDTYYQADIAVTCTPARPDERYLADPIVIVEVLSPSTATTDRGGKLPDYRSIPTVQEILLVSSWERRVEHWRRTNEGWAVAEPGEDAILRLGSLAIELPVSGIYEGIELTAPRSIALPSGTG